MKLTKSQLRTHAEVFLRFTCSNCGMEETIGEGLGGPAGWEFEEGEFGESLCGGCSGNERWEPNLSRDEEEEDLGLEPWVLSLWVEEE